MEGGVRAIVTMPPRHGKSHLVSLWGPVWAFEYDPGIRIALVSYGSDFARDWGRQIRNAIRDHQDELDVRLAPDSKRADKWNTTDKNGEGGLLTAGVDGEITGRGYNLGIIDDPVKNAEQARSEVYRERAWRFWTDTMHSRMEPNASVIVVQTRWHEDDLAGRLIKEGGWELVNLPAIAEENDALGREKGEALWPSRYPADCDKFREAQVYTMTWSALYQQRPSPAEGSMFKRKHFRTYRDQGDHYELRNHDGVLVTRVPKNQTWTAQTCDTAMKIGKDNDWTVVLTFAYAGAPYNALIILDVQRERLEVPDQWPFLCRQRDQWPNLAFQAVEEKGSGIGLVQQSIREGRPLKALKADTDKMARAVPLSIFYESGLVYHPHQAEWLGAFEGELLSFPNGTHDDQVDAAAYTALLVQEFGHGGEMPVSMVEEKVEDDEGWEEPVGDRFSEAYPF